MPTTAEIADASRDVADVLTRIQRRIDKYSPDAASPVLEHLCRLRDGLSSAHTVLAAAQRGHAVIRADDMIEYADLVGNATALTLAWPWLPLWLSRKVLRRRIRPWVRTGRRSPR